MFGNKSRALGDVTSHSKNGPQREGIQMFSLYTGRTQDDNNFIYSAHIMHAMLSKLGQIQNVLFLLLVVSSHITVS